MKKFYYFLVLFSAFSHFLFSQKKDERTYSEIRKPYEKMTIDDINAMPYVKLYIQKAKNEKNFSKLIQGYRDGRQFDYKNKMKYADSALVVSLQHGTQDDISKEYLSKGIIYYFYQKKYKLALNEYLKAYSYLKGSKDQYHYYKVLYHLGIVKGHLGYYDEAMNHFLECTSFYRSKLDESHHENEKFNYEKAYLNCLHQLTVLNRYLNNFDKSDSLSILGYRLSVDNSDFALEKSYFLKCIGISRYHKKDYNGARNQLQESLPTILKRNDFAWASVVYYYLGKTYEAQNDIDRAVGCYEKIDSIFTKHDFILPEVYKSYHYLIDNYKNEDVNKQLYYTNQLLKADSLISKDFPYLSSKLHRDFDRKALIDAKEEIEKSSNKKIVLAQILIVSGSVVLGFMVVRHRKDQKIKKQYNLLQKRIAEGTYNMNDILQEDQTEFPLRKTSLTPGMTNEIKEKLKRFEQEEQFRKKGITQKSIALKLGTNSHYLSVYINEQKGMNFNRYMAELRINYITNLLNTNSKYLNYTIEALAEECGIAARQNFSNLFFDINGIRPTDYIKNRKKELGIS
ncbi:AraC-like DNA-binding protein [Chryseobacterium vietnamense]|uniref:helix-turn-helix domain-containing protein n=1 Tax=Chryseobacterium vietnamense TaxID=866785 RepID=UPI002858DF8D|nr:AraC family transcriptional regulator [Chryseobacterium vietnamense]MDR6487195.1 AraC-like DNA-binding protein [Chryseobacterium vietnamense]